MSTLGTTVLRQLYSGNLVALLCLNFLFGCPSSDSSDSSKRTTVGAPVRIGNLSVDTTDALTTSEGGDSVSISIALTIPPTSDVTVSIASSLPNEGLVTPSSLVFTSSNWDIAQTVTVTGVDDDIIDGSTDYEIDISTSSADAVYNALAITSVALSNSDNDCEEAYSFIEGQCVADNQAWASVSNLVAWYETSYSKSFEVASDDESIAISKWKDISGNGRDAIQSTSSLQPSLVKNGLNGKPVMNFTRSATTGHYFNLPDGTVPYNNSAYTVLIVASRASEGNYGLLRGGNCPGYAQCNAFGFTSAGEVFNSWWNDDAQTTSAAVAVNEFKLLTFSYNQAARSFFVNGSFNEQAANTNVWTTGNQVTSFNNVIGVGTNAGAFHDFLDGDIAEIIIFDKALSATEQGAVENYLKTKWGVGSL